MKSKALIKVQGSGLVGGMGSIRLNTPCNCDRPRKLAVDKSKPQEKIKSGIRSTSVVDNHQYQETDWDEISDKLQQEITDQMVRACDKTARRKGTTESLVTWTQQKQS